MQRGNDSRRICKRWVISAWPTKSMLGSYDKACEEPARDVQLFRPEKFLTPQLREPWAASNTSRAVVRHCIVDTSQLRANAAFNASPNTAGDSRPYPYDVSVSRSYAGTSNLQARTADRGTGFGQAALIPNKSRAPHVGSAENFPRFGTPGLLFQGCGGAHRVERSPNHSAYHKTGQAHLAADVRKFEKSYRVQSGPGVARAGIEGTPINLLKRAYSALSRCI